MLTNCPFCMSENFTFVGMDDCGVDYGKGKCKQYDCGDCGRRFVDEPPDSLKPDDDLGFGPIENSAHIADQRAQREDY